VGNVSIKTEGNDEMTKTSISVQDLQRRLYVKAKTKQRSLTLEAKPTGKRSAGNPHAAFDAAGAGNGARSRYENNWGQTTNIVKISFGKRGLSPISPRSASPVTIAPCFFSCLRIKRSITASPARLDTRPVASGYLGGISTHWITRHGHAATKT
jgi:hypothetical protein